MGTSCRWGSCACPAGGERYCASTGACEPVFDNPAHCGRCDNVCPAEATCARDTCICPVSGETPCDGACVDTVSDEAHCGGCGVVCPASQECRGGTCACPSQRVGPQFILNHANVTAVGLAAGSVGGAAVYVEEDAARVNHVLLRRLAADGSPLGPAVDVSGLATRVPLYHPSIVDTGSAWRVIWHQRLGFSGRTIQMQTVAYDGTLGARASVPAVDSVGAYVDLERLSATHSTTLGTVVVGTAHRVAGGEREVLLRVLGDGTAPAAPVVLNTEPSDWVDLAGGAGGAVGVVFEARYGGFFYRRVEPDGSLVEPPLRWMSGVSPRLADAGDRFLLTWKEAGAVNVAAGPPFDVAPPVALDADVSRSVTAYPVASVRGGLALVTYGRGIPGSSAGTGARVIEGRFYDVPISGPPVALTPRFEMMPLRSVYAPHQVARISATRSTFAWVDWTGGTRSSTVEYVACMPSP